MDADKLRKPSLRAAPWQALDERLFKALGAGHAARPAVLHLACAIAHWSWVPLLGLMATALAGLGLAAGGWLLAKTLLLAGVVQLAAKRLARQWLFARPFMLGLSPNHLQHSLRGGFPSTHATVMGTVLGYMAPQLPAHGVGLGMGLVVLATGWARIYAGAHFPIDVLAGTALGLACGALAGPALGL